MKKVCYLFILLLNLVCIESCDDPYKPDSIVAIERTKIDDKLQPEAESGLFTYTTNTVYLIAGELYESEDDYFSKGDSIIILYYQNGNDSISFYYELRGLK